MTDYFAKSAYTEREAVQSYDAVRFTSPQGKLKDEIERRAVSDLLAYIGPPVSVLDLATGTGRFAVLALKLENRVVAGDISLEMLKVARQRLHYDNRFVGAIQCDVEKLPFKDNSFDCIVVIRLLGLVPKNNQLAMLSEIRRVTRRWAIWDLRNSFSVMVVLKAIWKLIGRTEEYYPWHPTGLKKKLAVLGFRILEVKRPLLIPPGKIPKPLFVLTRMVNWLGSHSFFGLFSEHYYLLVEKREE